MNHRRYIFAIFRMLLVMALLGGLLQGSSRPAIAAIQVDIPGPTGSGKFGSSVTVLPSGNIVVTDPEYDHIYGGTNVGAVYLYNGANGVLISTLTGYSDNDNVGSGGVTVLSNGNYVVSSPNWGYGAGAVTWGNMTSGISGEVSEANSLIGGTTGDQVGSDGVTALSNGNYVVRSPSWGSAAGAVTWGDGTGGVSGQVSAANSLVGSTAGDQVGWDVTALSNGNYVVLSIYWDNGAVVDTGAVTWGDGTTGVAGEISALNSLVGSTANDWLGYHAVELSTGNYLVLSESWDNGAQMDAGAVTWGNGASGVSGVVSAANSLVGSSFNDGVGTLIAGLSNGNYVVYSPYWANGAVVEAGAVTWGDGTTGVTGEISALNSLVGSTTWDHVGASVTALSNGNYVVNSIYWDNGAVTDAGAVTWGDGTSGTTGVVSAANSLVGSTAGDQVGYVGLPRGHEGVIPLSNGNYVVRSIYWDNGAVTDAGAVTWGDGTGGVSGAVLAANSLVGSTAGDQVGYVDVTPLSNGNYVVNSHYWDNGGVVNAGAVTWGDGTSGVAGAVTAANSLVGSTAEDRIGYEVTPLINGNYVAVSPFWDNGAAANAGAVTWGDGTSGISGAISAANSLVGGTLENTIGFGGVTALSNGNYVVSSENWDNGASFNVGAVTWGDGTSGVSGVVSAANSLVGSTAHDQVSYGGLFPLSNGNYVVHSNYWDNGAVVNAGAVTWGNGTSGISGVVSAANSLVGITAQDQVGSGHVTALSNGSYVVRSPVWDKGGVVDTGAVSWGFGASGAIGPITVDNSVRGTTANGGATMIFKYDAVNNQLVVGRPADNIVTLFALSGSVYSVSVEPPTSANSGAPGTTVTYSLQLTNTSYLETAFEVTVSGNAWTTNDPGWIPPLAPGASQTVNVDVVIPDSAAGGSTDTVTVTFTAAEDHTKSDSAVLATTASSSSIYDVAVEPPTAAKSGAPGGTVNYSLQVTNIGSIADTFNVAVSGEAWTTNAPATVGPLVAGAGQAVNVSVLIPASAANGSTDTATITVTSQGDLTKSDSAVLTTTAITGEADLEVGISASPDSVVIGSKLTYTIVVTNHGPGNATGVTLIDNLPAGGTYVSNDSACTHAAGVVTCNLGGIANGASKTVHIIVSVTINGPLTNNVDVTADQPDPSPINNSEMLTTQIGYIKIYIPIIRR